GDLNSRDQMIRFDSGLCVGKNFACGTNAVIPAACPTNGTPCAFYKTLDGPTSPPPGTPWTTGWTFIEYSSPRGNTSPGTYGYYAAVYHDQAGFGFVEVYDTNTLMGGGGNPNKYSDLAGFKTDVLKNNPGPFSAGATNTYTTVDGHAIQFSIADSKILSFDGQPPYDPTRTNGDVIQNDGHGNVTIKNPAL